MSITYSKLGPFQNGSSPPINSQLLNGIENYLVAINTAATDANISSDGTGVVTLNQAIGNKFQLSGGGAQFAFLAGSLSRVSFFSGSGSQTVSHGLGATPTFVLVMYAGSSTPFGSPPTQPIYYYNANVSTVQIVAQTSYSWLAMAFHS